MTSNRELVRRDYVGRHPEAAGLSNKEIGRLAYQEQQAAHANDLPISHQRRIRDQYSDDPIKKAYLEGYADGAASMGRDYGALEALYLRNQARTHGYVVRTASDPPDAPGPIRENHHAYDFQMRNSWGHLQSRERVPYVLNPDDTWTRGARCSVIKRTDYVQKFPPKVCENCRTLFVAARADAVTCSPRCRTAMHRARASLTTPSD